MKDASRVGFWVLSSIVVLEILSVLTIFHPFANGIAAIAIGILALIVTIFHPEWTLSAMAVEFLIGSKGALLKLGGDAQNDGGVSLRVILAAAFFFGWIIWSVRKKSWRQWGECLEGRWLYFILAALLVYAILRGFALNGPITLFFDANAWMLWSLLLPVLDVISHARAWFQDRFLAIAATAAVWLAVKTLVVFFAFSHGLAFIGSPLYLWIRRTGVGEVTQIAPDAYRVFFQSHIYAVMAVLVIAARFFFKSDDRGRRMRFQIGLQAVFLAEVLISLSRSLWLGLGAGLLVLTVMVWKTGSTAIASALQKIAIAFAIAILSTFILFELPVPRAPASSFLTLFYSRADVMDASGTSRSELARVLFKKIAEHPWLGSGFGATVTYQSADPRALSVSRGLYTTYAFEWGWLEHWIKFGIIGIPLMFFIVFDLARRVWRSRLDLAVRLAVVVAIVALAVIHIFTPYLNHPLGFAVLFAAEGLIILSDARRNPGGVPA